MRDFFAGLFELFGSFRGNASDDLYEFVYVPAGLIMAILTILLVCVWYFALFRKKSKFNTTSDWALWGLGSITLVTVVVLLFTVGKLGRENLSYSFLDYIEFLIMAFLWSLVIYFLTSISVKNFSPTKRRIPF